MCQQYTISAPYDSKMVQNKSALGSVLALGASNRDNRVLQVENSDTHYNSF